MQDKLFSTKLAKRERKRIERLLLDYHRMPAKIESAKMRAEQAVTASYTVQEGSRNASPSDPTAALAMKRDEIKQMERLYGILAAQRSLMSQDEVTIWDTMYHPGHRHSATQVASTLRTSERHFFNLRDRLISNIANVLEGRYDVTFWEDGHDE